MSKTPHNLEQQTPPIPTPTLYPTDLLTSLTTSAVHLWLTQTSDITEPKLLQAYWELLNHSERTQQQRFVRQHDAHRYLITRALVRTTLSLYTNQSPETWRFTYNAYGRPEIAPDQCPIPLRFNVSHTHEHIACLVHLAADAGVDIENTKRVSSCRELASHFFTPTEAHNITQAPDEQTQRDLFFTYWTLKEAYVKARGMGLSIPLDQFSFARSSNSSIVVDFASSTQQQAEDWQFALYRPYLHCLLALALHRPQTPDYHIASYQCVPLKYHHQYNMQPIASSHKIQ
jgi:4'-phosphopantetheinyl transferase